jgi:aspartyl-tRNA(Asn)/glutamyl-tRNA(Gln) amidotransferase subunit A
MRAAGAVHLGKLVLSEFALGLPDPDNGFPIPCNPWNSAHSAAGSSSGTGIAVAAGLALCGFGTDTGGSIRGPAAYNGVSGIKPTFGRVPKSGCVPLGYSLDNIGPLARSAKDCAIMLQAIAGYDASDPCAVDVPVPDYLAALDGSLSGLRVGVPSGYFFDAAGLDPQVKAAVEHGIDTLRQGGATVIEVALPHAEEAKDANMVILFSEAFAYHRQDLASRYDDYGKFTAPTLARGALFSGSDFVQAQRFRSYWRKKVATVMEDLDLLVTPTMPTSAPRQADMTPESFLKLPSFMGQWNLTGLPALAVPCGFSSDRLPISMQLIGHPFAEATVLRAGDAYQRLTDWHLQLPPV